MWPTDKQAQRVTAQPILPSLMLAGNAKWETAGPGDTAHPFPTCLLIPGGKMCSGEALAHTSPTPLSLQACCISSFCLISLWGNVASLASSPKADVRFGIAAPGELGYAVLYQSPVVWWPWCCSTQWVQNGREILVLSTSPSLYWVAQACWQL